MMVIGETPPVPYLGSLSADLYDLLSEIFAVQEPKKCFRHAFDSLEHVLFETDLSSSLPTGETLQRFIAPVPPVEHQKSVDAGAAADEMAHEPLADFGLAELARESNAAANHHTRADGQIFHHAIVHGTRRVVEEDIDATRAGFLDSHREIGGFLVIDRRTKTDFPAPFQLIIASGDCHGTTSRQFGDLADQLADRS